MINSTESVVSELGKLSLITSMSNKSCYDQTVKIAENLSNVLSTDVPRIIRFAENDQNAFANTLSLIHI